jgi:hypothetical protein
VALTMICPCGKILDIDEPAHGKPAQCPSCGNVFVAGKPIRSTTAIQDGEPDVKAGSPNSAAELNADEHLPRIRARVVRQIHLNQLSACQPFLGKFVEALQGLVLGSAFRFQGDGLRRGGAIFLLAHFFDENGGFHNGLPSQKCYPE